MDREAFVEYKRAMEAKKAIVKHEILNGLYQKIGTRKEERIV